MLPTDAKARKDIPIYSGFIKYFPDAIAAVAELSRKGNDQHNPGKPLAWDRSKSGDELDAQLRHICDMAGGTEADTDGVLHATKNAWRAMANLQKLLEAKKKAAMGDIVDQAMRRIGMASVDSYVKHGLGVWSFSCPAAAGDGNPTRTQSIPAAERMPMTAKEEAVPAAEYPAPNVRATRWLMRKRDGGFWVTQMKYTPAELDTLAPSVPVCRIED
jgi:hypothetical protein